MLDPIVRFFVTSQLRTKELVAKTRSEEGASAVEYGLLVGLIAAVIVGAVLLLGTQLSTLFSKVTDALTGAGA
jgi:Flp pilus assembly pilin Flp